MDPQPFKIEFDRSGSHLTLYVEGEIDAQTAPELVVAFLQHNDPPAALIWIDLSAVTFFDSSGLLALQRLHQRSVDDGITFKLVDPSPRVDRLLQLTGLDSVIPAYRNQAADA